MKFIFTMEYRLAGVEESELTRAKRSAVSRGVRNNLAECLQMKEITTYTG